MPFIYGLDLLALLLSYCVLELSYCILELNTGMWQTDSLNFLCLLMLTFVLGFLGDHSFTMQVSI